MIRFESDTAAKAERPSRDVPESPVSAPADTAKPAKARRARKPAAPKAATSEATDSAFDRKAYQRDLMRKRRATQGEAA